MPSIQYLNIILLLFILLFFIGELLLVIFIYNKRFDTIIK